MPKTSRWISLVAVVALATSLLPVAAGGQTTEITPINVIQGDGAESELLFDDVTVRGVVVGDFPGFDGLRGFYVQEIDQVDADPATSEGIFVFSTAAVDVGDYVEISGEVRSFDDQTQLSFAAVTVLDTVELPTPTLVSLPVPDSTFLERYEGMLVVLPQTLFISEYFNYDRFGEIVLTTDRQYQGTHVAEPGPAANAVTAANELARITLDDGSNSQNPEFSLHPNGEDFSLTNSFRGGDTVANVTGILGEGFGRYRIQPTAGADYVNANPRPTAPEAIPGDVRVASFNVLNFFTTIDSGPNVCGPTRLSDCRGADSVEEYERQLAKLVNGIVALEADIVGIQEIENDIFGDDGSRAHDAVLTLVEELNIVEGAGTWAWAGEATYYNDYPVRNDIIYRPASVEPVGGPIALQHDAFDAVRPDQDPPGDVEPVGRPPLAQTFRQTGSGSHQPFTVVVNHFKSKGSACDILGDPDTGDGQAECNLTRVAQAEALLDFIAELEETSSGILVIGDLNSYAMEDPIDTLRQGGLVELVEKYEGPDAYSYVFDGQLGYLDTALATRSMANWVRGLTIWHINADEPDILDYDTTFKSETQASFYEEAPYRSSDHDPVIVGITFGGRGSGARG